MRGSFFDIVLSWPFTGRAVYIRPFSQVHQITQDAEYQILSILF